MTAQDRLRVVWLTNFDAPYRRPLWSALGARVDLEVQLLQARASEGITSNRGTDWDRSSTSDDDGYAVRVARSFPLQRKEGPIFILTSARRIASGADVLLLGGWESPAYWQAAFAARRLGVRLAGFYESHAGSSQHTDGPVAAARRHWFRSLDAVVVPGPASHDALLGMGVDETKIFEGFNAVDVETFRSRSIAARAPGGTGTRYLAVGQLIDRKNIDVLIRAFTRVAQAADTLTIVGQGPLRSELEELTRSLGVAEQVRFLGQVGYDRLPEVFAAADVLAMPSAVEVWGLVVNEALACGLGAVVSDRAGVARSVAEMPGVVVAPPTVDGFAVGLAEARSRTPDPWQDTEILQHTPARFADVFAHALRAAAAAPAGSRQR